MNPLSDFGDDTRQMTGAIMTSYPFDSEFFEEVVLDILADKGTGSKNLVLVDSSKYLQTFYEEGSNPISSAGFDYQLAPVEVDGRRVFHPKIYFFAGERRVYAFVGSANLTQKGFTDNAETWASYVYEKNSEESDWEDLFVLKDVRDFFVELLQSEFAESIGSLARDTAFEEIFEAVNWIDEEDIPEGMEQNTRFIHNLDHSIFGQFWEQVTGDVENVKVLAPYFGETSRLLESICAKGDFDVDLYLQQNKAQFDTEVLEKWLEEYQQASLNIFETSRFVHGKTILVKTEESSYCLFGSPNPSIKGMMESARDNGNIEAGIIRIADRPDYFDYLFEDELVENVVGKDAEIFNPVDEPIIEDEPSESVSREIRILDAVYNRETTFTGGKLEVEVLGDLSSYAEIIVKGENGSFKFSMQDAGVEEIGDGQIRYEFRISSEEKLDVLNSMCRIWVEDQDIESSSRWVSHKVLQEEEIVKVGVESGATDNVPERIPDFLLGEEELRAEVLHTVGKIINGLDDLSRQGSGGGSGGRRRSLPPDWESSSGSTSKGPEEFLDDLFDAWISQIRTLIRHMGDTESDVLVRDLAEFVKAINQATAHLMIIDNKADELDFEGGIHFRHIPRGAFRELYKGDDSLVARFVSRLVEREMNREGPSHTKEIYSSLFDELLPQIFSSYLIIDNEEVEDFQDHFQEWFGTASTYCYLDRYPLPENFSSKKIGQVMEEIEEFAKELEERYNEDSAVSSHIDSNYKPKDGQLQNRLIEFYAVTLLSTGPKGIKGFYRQLHDMIRSDREEAENIQNDISSFSARISRLLREMDEKDKEQYVAALEEVQKEWEDVSGRYHDVIEYAFPVEE